MSIAQTIRASGDTLSASLDTDKFTGTSIRQTRMLLEEEKGRADVFVGGRGTGTADTGR